MHVDKGLSSVLVCYILGAFYGGCFPICCSEDQFLHKSYRAYDCQIRFCLTLPFWKVQYLYQYLRKSLFIDTVSKKEKLVTETAS